MCQVCWRHLIWATMSTTKVYQACRRTIHRPQSYFYQGNSWSRKFSYLLSLYLTPIALSIQGLTTSDKAEKFLLDQLVACDGGTGVMHESFHPSVLYVNGSRGPT